MLITRYSGAEGEEEEGGERDGQPGFSIWAGSGGEGPYTRWEESGGTESNVKYGVWRGLLGNDVARREDCIKIELLAGARGVSDQSCMGKWVGREVQKLKRLIELQI